MDHPSGIIVAGAMIRVPGDDCHGPIELLGHESPHDLVRHSERAEGNDEFGTLANPRVQAIRSADNTRHARAALIAPLPDSFGENLAGRALPTLVEHDEHGRSGLLQKGRSLLRPPVIIPARPAFRQFDEIETGQAKSPAHAFDPLPIPFDQLPFGTALETAHGQQA
jgi:hypothetical protein